ncbi:MAG TPA: hybrid sensor histidine kinase/response regulator, partial [Spirochaetota bacterium]
MSETFVLQGFLSKEEQSEKRARLTIESHVVFDINEGFINTFDIEKLKEAVLRNLPAIKLEKFFLCLFDDDNREKSRILLSYDHNKREKISNESFPSHYLLPSKINKDYPFEYVVMSINFKDESFGYIMYDIQTLTSFIYETLSVQISGAIKGAYLTSELHEYTTQLEEKVAVRTIELENANNQLKELDTLKNDFIANITHDFRSPLTVILNVADLAIRFDKRVSEEAREKFGVIFKSSIRLKNTIDRLLNLAKIDARGLQLKIEKTNLTARLDTLIDYYKSAVVSSNIQIVKKLPDHEVADFYTDIEKLEEILDNILSNAIKFVDVETGIITLEMTEEDRDIMITISDNGIGIPKDKLDVIFRRFEQAQQGKNSVHPGTGIGLAFSRQLAEYLKIDIWAESEGEGQGSKFYIKMKRGKEHFSANDIVDESGFSGRNKDIKILIEAELEDKLQRENLITIFNDLNKENESDYKKGVILVIDDDKTIGEIIINYLNNAGFRNFIIASDGKLGLEAVYDYEPDIIICDYNMPQMKGDDLHNRLIGNPKYREIPFIFLSAVADEGLMLERRRIGAAAFLKKPIEDKLLVITVDELLKKYFELKKIIQLATIDELTGLNNRRAV